MRRTLTCQVLLYVNLAETLLDLATHRSVDIFFNSLWTYTWIINRQHVFKESLKETMRK